MSGDSVSHNPRVRLATHPEDLPWDSMGKECAWPPLTKRHEIRVLKNIQWGIETYFCGEQYEISGEIFCEMEVLDLDDLGDSYYTALSYTWGDPFPEDYRCWDEQEDSESRENGGINDDENEPSRDYYIHCNGGSIRVTKNLHAALRSGHIHRLEGPLWVDAVSINQDDVAERSLQVGMMDKIYIQAESVLVWLGPKDESSEITIKLAQTISKSYQKMEKEDRPRGHFPFNDPTLYAILGVKPITIKEWDSVIRFFSRTWFRRIWMVQEVALAHRLHFVCGEDDLGWSTLAGFADWIHTFGWDAELKHQMMRNKLGGDILGTELLNLVLDVGKSIDEGVDGEQTRKLLRSFFGVDNVEENGVVFMGLLAYRSQHRTATNPRDKIYGLLGLFQKFRGDRTWECPAVDYSKSVEQVFQEFGELLLRHSKSLGVLSLVEPSQEGELPKLPSWIPDFNKARSTESLIAHECHDACKGWSFVPPKIIRDSNRLELEGLKLDTITTITGTLAESVTSTNDLMPIFNLANSLGETYTTGEASLQALFEVLTMNCCTENWTKPASDNSHRKVEHDTIKESFQSWLKYHISSRSYRLGLGVPVLEATSEVASFLASSAIFPDFEDIAAYYERFLEILMEDPEVPASEWNREKFHREILDPILSFEQMSMYSLQRRLVITAKGFMGLVSRSGEVGDEVWILRGARVPFILRRLETGTYQLLGEVYLHGYMNGEVFTRDGMNVEESVRVTLE